MAKTKLTLNICGLDYTISSDEEEDYVKMVAEEVSQSVLKILNGNTKISAAMAATLTALEYCDIAKKASTGADNLRMQIRNYLEDLAKVREELEEKKKQIDGLRLEVKAFKSKSLRCGNSDYEKKVLNSSSGTKRAENIALGLKTKEENSAF